MKIGIIREGKTPPDSRVPLTPAQCAYLIKEKNVDITVQPSSFRCFSDEEYQAFDVPMSEDLSDRDTLMGVKEVPIDQLRSNKTYLFFSHTLKEQVHNRKLLQAIIQKNIRLIDYEVLTNEKGQRLIAFGQFAGMVGAHNGIMAYGNRTGTFQLKRMKDCLDYAETKSRYRSIVFPAMRIVLTGSGRVGNGAAMVLDDMGIKKVSPEAYLNHTFDHAVYTQLNCIDYAQMKDGSAFDKKIFYGQPELFESIFAPYFRSSDIMINGIYWDIEAPAFFTLEEMRSPDFKIKVIADITCDIAPGASIPSTIRASTIDNPVFGFNSETVAEEAPYQEHVIDMMTIDNLPNELPRDASAAFGEQFISYIIDQLSLESSDMIERATIAMDAGLGSHFMYLEHYLKEA
ncbi:MAG: saccharopine dehydrogenase (NAD+, L-lysine-forming) [Saprospiraceae bacterium]|jgi:saccharopine dehydrogenase (NAD+, L-lysine-forming)